MHLPGSHKVCHIVNGQDADGISLACTCNTMARADPAFERIFFNLVGNAVRLREAVTAITVSCSKDPDESRLRLFAVDGCGVPQISGGRSLRRDTEITRVSASS